MKLQEIYRNDAHMYSICRSDRTDSLVLHTLSGGIGMFSSMIELLPEEEELFKTVGHLDGLAYNVARLDPIVEGRYIKPLDEYEKIEFVLEL